MVDKWDEDAMAATLEAVLDCSSSVGSCDIDAMAASIEVMLDCSNSTDKWDIDAVVVRLEAMLDGIVTDTETQIPPAASSRSLGPGPKKKDQQVPGMTQSSSHCPVMTNEKAMFQTTGHFTVNPAQAAAGKVTSGMRRQDADKPYVKKPPNAFMIYKKEQRETIMLEFNIRNSAEVNKIVGERWRMLSAEDQAPYFDKARVAKREHEAKYPGWSANDNYGRTKRRKANAVTPTYYSLPAAPVQPGLYYTCTMVSQDYYHTALQIPTQHKPQMS
ncbi:sex-determining region Y protein-like [Eucyclogobius newberryi]|uniref:sex-determining region Y protein-like n=1 Tax=Eucyclogobius newberryi TaxID=166745 RepID=UPI003B5B6279